MSLTPSDARQLLTDATTMQRRSHLLYRYRQTSVYLFLWGAIWTVGYGISALWPYFAHPVWLILTDIGLIAPLILNWQRRFCQPSIYLTLWSLLWLVGMNSSYFLPMLAGQIWSGVEMLGIGGSVLIGFVYQRRTGIRAPWSVILTFIVFNLLIFFVFGALSQLGPHALQGRNPAMMAIPLIVALIYAYLGFYRRARRLLWTGLVMALLTVVGFYTLADHFNLWMAILGGGGLILAGFWFRRV